MLILELLEKNLTLGLQETGSFQEEILVGLFFSISSKTDKAYRDTHGHMKILVVSLNAAKRQK